MTGPDRIAVTVPEAVRLSGISRSSLYRLLGAGRLRAVKSGARLLILADSLKAHISGLPPAVIRPDRSSQ